LLDSLLQEIKIKIDTSDIDFVGINIVFKQIKMALEDWKDFIGNSATFFTILQFLMGIQVCLGFYKKQSTGETSCMTFIVGVVMTFVWFSYGRLVNDHNIMTVNVTGFVLQTIYCFVFYSFSTAKVQTGKKIFLTFLLLTLVQTYIVNENDSETAQYRIGLFAASLSVSYCMAPLATIQHVFRTRSTESLPFSLIVGSVFFTSLWSLYGIIIEDAFVKVPNMLSFGVAVFQLSLFACYPSTSEHKYASVI